MRGYLTVARLPAGTLDMIDMIDFQHPLCTAYQDSNRTEQNMVGRSYHRAAWSSGRNTPASRIHRMPMVLVDSFGRIERVGDRRAIVRTWSVSEGLARTWQESGFHTRNHVPEGMH